MNPLDWAAGPFLGLYVALAAATLLLLQHWRDRIGPDAAEGETDELDLFQIAYLSGGPGRAIDTALVGLFEAGAAVLDKRGVVATVDPLTPVPPEFEPYRTISFGSRQAFHVAFATRTARIRAGLTRRGLVPADRDIEQFRVAAIATLAVPLLLGASKVAVGLSRERPVGILLFLMILTGALGAWAALSLPHRSRAGAAALGRLRQENARAARAPTEDEIPLAFALTGAAVLKGRGYEAFLAQGSDGGAGGSDGGGDGGGGCGGCSA